MQVIFKSFMKKIIVVTVENKSGILNRVTALLRRRTFNIDSLTVAKTDNSLFSRMTIVLEGDVDTEQATKQLHRLIDVIKVSELTEDEVILHESLFLKVSVSRGKRSEILELSTVFEAKAVEILEKSIVFQLSDDPFRIDSFIELMKPFGIKELVRSGVTAIHK